MTLQVCLVGKDFVVFGTDRKVILHRRASHVTHGESERFFERGSRLYAFAGGPEASGFAAHIAKSVESANPNDAIDWFNTLRESAQDFSPAPAHQIEVTVIDSKHLQARLVIRHEHRVTVQKVWPAQCVGDNTTLAGFIFEHFYPKDASLAEAKFLAALVLWYGARENPSEVGPNIDLIVCSKGSVLHISSGEIEKLQSASKKFHDSVKKLVWKYTFIGGK